MSSSYVSFQIENKKKWNTTAAIFADVEDDIKDENTKQKGRKKKENNFLFDPPCR